jgi:hypothetical protein
VGKLGLLFAFVKQSKEIIIRKNIMGSKITRKLESIKGEIVKAIEENYLEAKLFASST